ncbi:Transcription factor CPH2 [Yarrowia sp. B02]|nr:Transcription factor CPH2 [Yarrowia sp. B02]
MKFEFVDCDNLLDTFAPPRQDYMDFRQPEDLSFLDYPEQPVYMNDMDYSVNNMGLNPMALGTAPNTNGVLPQQLQQNPQNPQHHFQHGQNMLTPPYLSASASDNSPESVGSGGRSPVSDASSPEMATSSTSPVARGARVASSAPGKVMKPKKGRSSHNMIEKKYRTNINDKISALRDCVPALRCALKGTKDDEELDGLTPASKLNKATVLSKATEYIKHLKTKNDEMQAELDELRRMMGKGSPGSRGGSPSNMLQQPAVFYDETQSQQQMRQRPMAQQQQQQHMQQQHHMNGAQPHMQQQPQQSRSNKAMLGLMTGVMATGLMSDYGGDSRELSFIPVPLLRYVPAESVKHGLLLLKLTMVIGAAMLLLLPLFHSPTPPPHHKQIEATSVEQYRRQSWLVNSHFLATPQSSVAYCVETAKALGKALLRFLIGDGYLLLQSSSYHLPISRAVEAQLCGGQENVSRADLLVTYLQTLTLPPTPVLCATQAIHVHVLANGLPWLKRASVLVADRHWKQARKLSVSKKHSVPSYLSLLLAQNDVFDSDIIQRFYNFAHGLDASHGCSLGMLDEGFITATTDSALKTPLEVLAAWYSTRTLREVILFQLEANEVDYNKLDTSLAVSPTNSIAKRRATIAHSVVLGRKDPNLVKNALVMVKAELGDVPLPVQRVQPIAEEAVEEEEEADEEAVEDSESEFSDDGSVSATSTISDTPVSYTSSNPSASPVARDSQIAIHCAFILYYLSEGETEGATKLLQKLRIRSVDEFGLLSFFSVWTLFSQLQERPAHRSSAIERRLEELVASGRIWLGSEKAELEGLSLHRRRSLVNKCVKMGMEFGGFEDDEGYQSQ